MNSLYTGFFARMFTVIAVIGLVMGGVSVEAMPQVASSNSTQVVHVAGEEHQHAASMAQMANDCVAADMVANDCLAASADEQCESAGDCCPHCVTALPVQIDSNFGSLPTVQTATPQWRLTSVTPVTEIRPPIYIS